MKIFGVPISVHTRKVIAAARYKQLPYELSPVVPVLPEQLPPNWRTLSPTGLIPVLQDGDYLLPDSTAIVHYLERVKPSPSLLPSDAKQLGAALFLDAWSGSELFRKVIHPIFHQQVVAPNIQKIASDQNLINTALQNALGAFSYVEGSSLVGEHASLSIADLSVISNLVMFHYLGHRIDRACFPALSRYFQRSIAMPFFREILSAERPFAENMGLDLTYLPGN